MMRSRYALDKANAKLMGVCAGFARWADVDPLLVRLTLVMLTLFVGPLALLVYLLTALIAADATVQPRESDARPAAGAAGAGSPRE